MKNLRLFRRLSCATTACVFLFTGMISAHAATITVTTTTDELADPGPGAGCSLREAIQSINSAANYGGCTGTAYGTSDTINIPAGTYTVTISGVEEYLNANGSFDILKNVSIVGAGANLTTINGGGLDRVFFIESSAATVSISGVTVTNGLSGGGSGIYNNGGTLTVTNSTFNNNTATGGSSCGGAIAGSLNRPLTVTNSTISGNSSVWCGGGIISWGSFTVANSTISGNSSTYGGGIFRGASGGGASTVTNSTIIGNSASNGAGIWDDGGGTVTLANSIVANQISGADCGGASIVSGGHNLESATSCGFTGTGDLQNTDPLLGALASNGGPTQTMALTASSPAINAGDNAICAASPVSNVDQRGYVRPAGAGCDIGAYEYAPIPPVSVATPIPTLSEWALIMLAGWLGLAGLVNMRRKN